MTELPVNPETPDSKPSLWGQIFSRRMLICVFTGFTSGLPLYVLINLLPAWLRTEGVDLKAIGLFALIGFPFTWKFVWAPLMDRYRLPFLGHRRGWMLLTQLALMLFIAGMALLSPQQNLSAIATLAFAIAFFSASQDIVLDAYRREFLPDRELGLGNSIHVNAYRLAALVPGSLSLIMATTHPWDQVFLMTALFMLPGIAMTLFLAREPKLKKLEHKTFEDTFVKPFTEFLERKGVKHALMVLAFIFLYKLGDSMTTALATPFYIDMGYGTDHIGVVAKNAGLWPAIVSGILGGIWMLKIGINRALWLFGVVQVLSILGFVWLASFGRFEQIGSFELWALAGVVGFEYVGVGLGTAAFVAFMARETNPSFTATQLALFTSLAAVPRTFINSASGYLVDAMGYTQFYWLCFALAFPGMIMLWWVAPWRSQSVA
ncbi:MAG: AmpG family muropeptide MFS transporter [Neisseriaceae bacterium]|nr:AmpG family muropeptide MFS transporter [Neisseriaceae bacterium]MBP6861940.1 AmpG family muropeptide MFS transporter [Neisseriaceae bacterium]